MTEFVFFDVRDTLGYVDRKGHLVPYKPSTEMLFNVMKKIFDTRIGIIMNLPADVSSDDGVRMLKEAGIYSFLDPRGIIINHDVGIDKPAKQIFEYASKAVEVPIERCTFIGENILETIGAMAAGMNVLLKPIPPGGEFGIKPRLAEPATPTFSGRLFETLLEEEHVIAKRITDVAERIAMEIGKGNKPTAALGLLVYLLENFVEPYHHRTEESAVLPIAIARGLPPSAIEPTLREHEQGRLYFRALRLGLSRVNDDHSFAFDEIQLILQAFVKLYRAHGPDENNRLFPEMGKYLTDSDDAVIIALMRKSGPSDLTPYLMILDSLEAEVQIAT